MRARRRLPRGDHHGVARAAERVAESPGSPTGMGMEDGAVSYATYCMDRGAAYLWGAYSNGPGVYDRARLMSRVGRQFGSPLQSTRPAPETKCIVPLPSRLSSALYEPSYVAIAGASTAGVSTVAKNA